MVHLTTLLLKFSAKKDTVTRLTYGQLGAYCMLTATGMCICIILTLYRYTLLVGKPPFETESLKDTYQRIKRNEYRIPSHISPSARSLITRLLRADPATRPTPQDILQDPFLTDGFIPARLPHRYMYIYFKVEQYYVCIFQSII